MQDLEALQLYGPLSALPKNVEAEFDPMESPLVPSAIEPARNEDKKPLTKRQIGRIKKRAVVQAIKQKQDVSPGEYPGDWSGDDSDASEERAEVGQRKRTRSDVAQIDGGDAMDNQ